MTRLPSTISLSDTALLNQLWAAGVTIDQLLASGAYRFGGAATDDEADAEAEAAPKGGKAKTTQNVSDAHSMQATLF